MVDPAALESHLSLLSFADPQGFLVLADWLQSQQEPWGELIALQHANTLELQPRIVELLGALELAEAVGARCEWQLGFARSVTLVPEAPTVASLNAAMEEFFARPIARLCDGVTFAPQPAELATIRDWDAWDRLVVRPYRDCGELLERLPDRVTRVGFGVSAPVTGYVRLPDFRELSGWLQRITWLSLIGNDGGDPSKLLLPNLVRLTLRVADMYPSTIASLVSSELPKLEEMWLSFGGSANCILDDVYPPDDYDEEHPDRPRYPPTFTGKDLALLEIHGVDNDPNRDLEQLGRGHQLTVIEATIVEWNEVVGRLDRAARASEHHSPADLARSSLPTT